MLIVASIDQPRVSVGCVRSLRAEDIPAVARLHADELREGILARLGEEFLARFYYRYIPESPTACCVVYEYDGQVAGFIAATTDWAHLFQSVARRHWGALVGVFLATVILKPSRWGAVGEAVAFLSHPPAMPDDAPSEMLSLAVAPAYRSLQFMQRTNIRVAQALGQAALDCLRDHRGKQVRALVRADNLMANIFYRNLGFAPAGPIRIFGGDSVVYVRDLEST